MAVRQSQRIIITAAAREASGKKKECNIIKAAPKSSNGYESSGSCVGIDVDVDVSAASATVLSSSSQRRGNSVVASGSKMNARRAQNERDTKRQTSAAEAHAQPKPKPSRRRRRRNENALALPDCLPAASCRREAFWDTEQKLARCVRRLRCVVVGCCSSCKTFKKGFPLQSGLSLHLSEGVWQGGRVVQGAGRLSLCSSAFAHSFHLRSFPAFPSACLLPAACCVLRLALLSFCISPPGKFIVPAATRSV